MPNVDFSLKDFEKVLDSRLDGKLEPIVTRLDAVEEILSSHTQSLDAITAQTKNWNTEMVVMRARMDRYERALLTVAAKGNVDISAALRS